MYNIVHSRVPDAGVNEFSWKKQLSRYINIHKQLIHFVTR